MTKKKRDIMLSIKFLFELYRLNRCYYWFVTILPKIKVMRSTTAKLKIKKFGAVLRYEFERIVKHVMMLPGIPNMDIAL